MLGIAALVTTHMLTLVPADDMSERCEATGSGEVRTNSQLVNDAATQRGGPVSCISSSGLCNGPHTS